MSDKLNDALEKATIIVRENIDPTEKLHEDKPLVDELVLSFFQLRNSDLSKDDVNHLDAISQYLTESAKTEDRLDKLQILREIRFKLGEPEIGQKRHDQVYQYIRLKQAAQKYSAEAQAMEG
jgi:hypothetical protein